MAIRFDFPAIAAFNGLSVDVVVALTGLVLAGAILVFALKWPRK